MLKIHATILLKIVIQRNILKKINMRCNIYIIDMEGVMERNLDLLNIWISNDNGETFMTEKDTLEILEQIGGSAHYIKIYSRLLYILNRKYPHLSDKENSLEQGETSLSSYLPTNSVSWFENYIYIKIFLGITATLIILLNIL